jgi:hypothetical protein
MGAFGGVRRPDLSLALACALAVAAAVAASPALASLPSLRLATGGTLAALGGVNEGGASIGLSALWPLEERLEAGAMLLADDLGSLETRLADPNDGQDLGAAERAHRAVWGAAWRLDARPLPGAAWEPWASGTWGFHYVRDDVRGGTTGRVNSTGFSLALGVRRALRGGVSAAGVVRYHRLFNDRAGRYVTAGVEWGWR